MAWALTFRAPLLARDRNAIYSESGALLGNNAAYELKRAYLAVRE